MGRKATITENHLVGFIRHTCSNSLSGMPMWMEDIVMGACYTSMGVSNGKLNANPSLVKASLFSPYISTDACLNIYEANISERTAQRVAKAARFALGGIDLFLSRETEEVLKMKKDYWLEKQFIEDYYAGRESKLYSKPHKPLPKHILELYHQGYYVEYAKQLQRISVG